MRREGLKARGFAVHLGRKKMRAAKRIAVSDAALKKASDIAARNAYRAAAGLPLIDPVKPSFTNADDRD
jgi:alpha-D-ribose 1-methylphosphonate 5-triphosphate synthase subunit PhnG